MTDSTNRTKALTAMLAFAACGAPSPAQAACQQWNVGGDWTLIQSNDTAASVRLQQTGNQFSGQAQFGHWVEDDFFLCDIGSCGKDYVIHSGPAVGTVNGDAFELTIYWNSNAIGVYTGHIGPQGLIVGTSFDKNDPATTAQWHSDRVATCTPTVAPAPVPAAPAAPTVRAMGRVHTDSATAAAPVSVCEAAKTARARNSPAAPGLEQQCAAQKALLTTSSVDGVAPATAQAKPAIPVLDEAWRVEHAARGEALVNLDPMALALRDQWQNAEKVRAFNIGMAVAEGQTALGPGKQAIHDALAVSEQRAFEMAVWYSIDRNANAALADIGAAIANADPAVAEARTGMSDPFYWLGFDIASGLFGDPALGSVGNTEMGPGSTRIRDGLNPASAREGFNDAVKFHLARKY